MITKLRCPRGPGSRHMIQIGCSCVYQANCACLERSYLELRGYGGGLLMCEALILTAILLAIDLHLFQLLWSRIFQLTSFDGLDQVLELEHGPDRDTQFILGDLHGTPGLGVADSFLPGQQQHNADDLTALGLDDGDSLAQSGTGGHDVVNDDDALPLQGSADNGSALAMILGLLAVERVRDGFELLSAELELAHHNRTQRDPLVRRAEQNVEMRRE